MVQPAMMRGDDCMEIIKPHHQVGVHLNQTAHFLLMIASAQPKHCRALVNARDVLRDLEIKNEEK